MAKLNAWKKAVKNSRHVTGSLRDELYLLSDLYDKLALCSLELYKFDFGNEEEIVFQAGEILSGSDWSKGNVEETDLRSNLKADVLAITQLRKSSDYQEFQVQAQGLTIMEWDGMYDCCRVSTEYQIYPEPICLATVAGERQCES